MVPAAASSVRPLPKPALVHLDLMRGLAAVFVLFEHARGLFFRDYAQLDHPSRGIQVAYLATGLGHQCVVVFFVLSGFFVGHSVLEAQREGTWRWRSYALRRLSRLYVVLVPGLLLTALWDRLGMSLFGTGEIYGGHLAAAPNVVVPVAAETGALVPLLGNLLFLEHLCVPVYGTNTPLWSLPFEFWFYVAFPLFVRALRGDEPMAWRIVMLVVALGVVSVAGLDGWAYFFIWCLGAAIAWGWRRRTVPARLRLVVLGVGVVAFAVTLFSARVRLWTEATRVNDVILGLGTGALVLALLIAARTDTPTGRAWGWYRAVGVFFAGCSYTLYLSHYPLLTFVHAGLFLHLGWVERIAPSAGSLGVMVLGAAAVVGLYAYPLSRLTEAHTDEVRRWIERKLTARPVPSASAS